MVRAVLLVREPWPQVQRTDELTLGDQRHDHLDVGRAEPDQRRRVELEALRVTTPLAAWR